MNPSNPVQYLEAGGTSRLHLTAALNPCDQVSDLVSGAVRAEGISLTVLQMPVEEIFFRFTHHQEWAVSEMSFAKCISLIAAASEAKPAPMVALPVFTSRMFRHSAIYVRSGAGIRSPKDLEGRTVGIPEWAQTAGVYVRGLLSERYGVDLRSIRWVQAGVNQAGRREKVELQMPEGVQVQVRADSSLNELLQSGEIDAAVSARPLAAFTEGQPHVQRLFPAFRAEELAYYQATSVFPIMHVVVLRRDAYEANRWLAMNLFKAFDEAKRRSVERAVDITASSVPLPWGAAFAGEMAQAFGGDPWPYGIEANRPTLEAFCRFAHDQGVARRRLEVEELFPAEVHKSVRV